MDDDKLPAWERRFGATLLPTGKHLLIASDDGAYKAIMDLPTWDALVMHVAKLRGQRDKKKLDD